jgi:hypothetical protein
MKNLGIVALVILLSASFTSCEKVKGIFDVDVETTLSGDLDIDIPESATKATGKYEFESSAVIDPTDNSDVADNADKIKAITADGIIATVTYVSVGDQSTDDLVLFEGTTFSIKNSTTTVSWKLSNDWPIQKGTELTLEDMQGIYGEVSNILTTLEPFEVICKGAASLKGISITIEIDINATITGNPF